MTSRYIQVAQVDTISDLLAFDGNTIPNNTTLLVMNSNVGGLDSASAPRNFRFVAGSAVADASSKFVVAPTVNPAGGKWITTDAFFDLAILVNSTQADASILWTIPTGFRVRPTRPMIEVGTAWSGGAGSAIGLSSSNANYNTKGDLMGGAGGNVAADLASGFRGTIGTKLAAAQPPVVLVAGDTVRFDRIVSNFTAGTGVIHFPVEIIP